MTPCYFSRVKRAVPDKPAKSVYFSFIRRFYRTNFAECYNVYERNIRGLKRIKARDTTTPRADKTNSQSFNHDSNRKNAFRRKWRCPLFVLHFSKFRYLDDLALRNLNWIMETLSIGVTANSGARKDDTMRRFFLRGICHSRVHFRRVVIPFAGALHGS